MVDERIQQADELLVGSQNYAKAFRVSARICRSRFPNVPEAQKLAEIFEEKARLEDDLCSRLANDPVGTLIEEGLA